MCGNDFILALVTINGVLLGFLGVIQSNILQLEGYPVLQLMQKEKYKNGKTRFSQIIEQIKVSRTFTLLSSTLGAVLLFVCDCFTPSPWCQYALLGLFLILNFFSIKSFYETNSSLDFLLRNINRGQRV